MVGSPHGWAQAKTDSEDPDLKRPGGAYRQLKYRALGSVIVVVLTVVVLSLVVDGA